jgi:GNAT superfamily N-acetyltransferase
LNFRPGRDADASPIIALITACWGEYPGVFMDVDGENPELRALATYFADAGGALWVAEQDGVLQGMVATRPSTGNSWELCRMYVSSETRGTGLASQLLNTAENFARHNGAHRLHLWSDTRFDRAHRFYERHGFVRDGGIKPLLDASNTLDFGYAKPLSGLAIWKLDTPAAASAARALGRILKSCVDDGASVSFLPPFALQDAEAFYRRKAREVALGHRMILAAWVDGTLAGTVTLDLDMPANQLHRADLQKLLVHPDIRRRGVARGLMTAIEAEADGLGLKLLVLDTSVGSSAEPLYRALGWTEVGQIPAFSKNDDGSMAGTTLFYKAK